MTSRWSAALRVLRWAYDGTFWFGATREMNRHGTTEEWRQRWRRRGLPLVARRPDETFADFKERLVAALKANGVILDGPGQDASKN